MVYALILENDKVALPGLGAFVAEMVPATFTDRGYTINPPYRRLSFRSQAADDSLLVDLYSASSDVDGDSAKREIGEFLSELKGILFAKKNVVFPGLGRLRATRENNVFFVADEDLDIYPEGFGLEPLSLKTRKETREDLARTAGHLEDILSAPVAGTVGEAAAASAEETAGTSAVEILPETGAEMITAVPESPAIETTTETVSGIIAEPAVEPAAEQTAEPETGTTEETSAETPAGATAETSGATAETSGGQNVITRRNPWRAAGITAAVLLALAALVVGGFIIISRIAPDFVDSLLYTAEELQIINWKL